MKEERLFHAGNALVGLTTLATCLIHNLRLFENKPLLIFDSSHYLLTANHIHKAILAFVCGNFPEALGKLTNPQAVADIFIDGPILPFAAALAALLTGREPLAINWPSIAILLALVTASTTCSVAYITYKLTSKPKLALLTGLLFGLSPGALLAANRFLTEPIAAYLLTKELALVAFLIAYRGKKFSLFARFLLGFVAGLGFYLKPALAIAWLLPPALDASYALTKNRWAKQLMPITATVSGFLLVIFCWLSFSFVGTGKLNFMPERMPAHNLAKGNDLEADGWATYPSVEGTNILQALDKPTKILTTAWSENPLGLTSLYLRKIPRLIFVPWNDFNQKPYELPISLQTILYQLLLLVGLTGFAQILINKDRITESKDREQKFLQWTLLLTATASVLIYLPFEAISRYGYPIYPLLWPATALVIGQLKERKATSRKCFWLLSILAITSVLSYNWWQKLPPNLDIDKLQLIHQLLYVGLTIAFLSAILFLRKGAKNLLCFSIIALISLGSAIACANFTLDYQSYLRSLPRGAILTKTIDLSKPRSNCKYLIVCDITENNRKFNISVNGTALTEPWCSMTSLNKDLFYTFNMKRMFAEAFDLSLESFRDWLVCPVPPQLVRTGANTLTLSAEMPINLGCDRTGSQTKTLQLPGLYCFSGGRLCNFPQELDGRLQNLTKYEIAETKTTCSGKNLENLQPRLFLMEISENSKIETTKFDTTKINETIKIQPEQFDVLLQDPSETSIIIDKIRLKAARSTGISLPIPVSFKHAKTIEITIRGQIRSLTKAGKGGLLAAIEGNNPSYNMVLPNTPPFLPAAKDWQPFQFTNTINCRSFPHNPEKLTISVFPGRWPQITQYGLDNSSSAIKFKDLEIDLKELNLPELAESQITLH
jgi:hypothetical protein